MGDSAWAMVGVGGVTKVLGVSTVLGGVAGLVAVSMKGSLAGARDVDGNSDALSSSCCKDRNSTSIRELSNFCVKLLLLSGVPNRNPSPTPLSLLTGLESGPPTLFLLDAETVSLSLSAGPCGSSGDEGAADKSVELAEVVSGSDFAEGNEGGPKGSGGSETTELVVCVLINGEDRVR